MLRPHMAIYVTFRDGNRERVDPREAGEENTMQYLLEERISWVKLGSREAREIWGRVSEIVRIERVGEGE